MLWTLPAPYGQGKRRSQELTPVLLYGQSLQAMP